MNNKKFRLEVIRGLSIKDVVTVISSWNDTIKSFKRLNDKNNPPTLVVEFFAEQKNIKNINCYSNDGGDWKKSNLIFENQKLIINFENPFVPRRGRVNCSLNDNGKWRWFGTQFTVQKN